MGERRTVKPTRKVPHPTCNPSVLFQMFPWALLLASFKQKTIIQAAIDDSGIRIKDQELQNHFLHHYPYQREPDEQTRQTMLHRTRQ